MAENELERRAFTLLARADLDISPCCEIGFSREAVLGALETNPGIVLVSASGFHRAAVDAVRLINRASPSTRVVLITDQSDADALEQWAQCSLTAVAMKEGGPAELKLAMSRVMANQRYISPSAEAVFSRPRTSREAAKKLSPRESELMRLLANGLMLREAAQRLKISYKTADAYRTKLFRKLGVRDRVELARFAIREGYVTV